ncbi:MAG: tetratricopeptide repeat protein [Acidobacteriota bacterium]
MVMKSGVAQQHIRSALRAELDRNFGRIGEIEQGLGRAEGYLGKYCRGETSIPMDVLLKCIELLDADPGDFFCQALGTPAESSTYLRQLMSAEPEKALVNLQKAAAEIAVEAEAVDTSDLSGVVETPGPEHFSPDAKIEKLVQTVVACSGIEQRRRLRSAKRYRSVPFVELYLKYLLRACQDDPKGGAKLAEVVAADLVPSIEGADAITLLELELRALGAWAFARRCSDDLDQAAAALHFALSLSSAYRLDSVTAELLRYSAHVLSRIGSFQPALKLLGESAMLFEECDHPIEVAKVLVQRGSVYNSSGDFLSAARVLQKALRRLPGSDPSLSLYRIAALQNLSRVYEQVGDLYSAECWLEKAVDSFSDEGDVTRAKLLWNAGCLAHRRRELPLAEKRLSEAQAVLVACEASECVLVALDLTRVFLELGKLKDAIALAQGMAFLIKSKNQNPILQGVLVELVRAAVEGQLSLALVEQLESQAERRAD